MQEYLRFSITEQEIAIALKLERTQLDEIVSDLELSLDSSIEFKESLHFRYLNRKLKERIFSQEGALAIASYIDNKSNDTMNIKEVLTSVIELVEKHRINRIDNSIRQTVYDNSSSLTVMRELHWLSNRDVVKIFQTKESKLEESFKNIQISYDPMKKGEDYEHISAVRYFSFRGLAKLSIELAASLCKKERKDYCQRVPIVVPPVVSDLLALTPSEIPSQKDIESAMRYVNKRDKERCQITGKSRDKIDKIDLARHHLFDQKNYTYLSAEIDNIITITREIHDDFHLWIGGTDKTCTIDDFIRYIETFYNQRHSVILMLYDRRQLLRLKLSQLQRYLPESNS
ncbi:hypothetical protein [Planktothrix sp. FACHB-1365]|uniref:hypothetical protein n=1 Tax=Planktothrix sp. FACHB-1365 TaxID=2692855 RepID=UPI0016851A22|nr:hypothetical protein [Planktothrix sp. FACHB-1365]MBD2481835.1 hypothetical protein [Planktothrix sp. FACHB-1365]